MGDLKLIGFDVDGVLVDSFPDQFNYFQKCCRVLGKRFDFKDIEEFRIAYTEPVYPNMYTLLGFNWEAEKDEIWKIYNEHKANSMIPFVEGMKQIVLELDLLKPQLSIATTNTRKAIDKYLTENFVSNIFYPIITKEDVPLDDKKNPKLKPNPDCLVAMLSKANVSSENSVYVGDQTTDIEACKRVKDVLGTPLRIIAYAGKSSYSTLEKLTAAAPDYIASSPEEIEKIIKGLA